MTQERTTIFAVAILPGGNILKAISDMRASSFALGDSVNRRALPEAVYLGFYTFFGAEASPGGEHRGIGQQESRAARMADDTDWARTRRLSGLAARFKAASPALLSLIPVELVFSDASRVRDAWYLQPSPSLGAPLIEACDVWAKNTGLARLESDPFEPGAGFFVSNDVTPAAAEAFSFRRMALALMEIEATDSSFSSARCSIFAKVPKAP